MEFLRNQFLGLFFRLCCLLLFISNFQFLYYLLHFYYSFFLWFSFSLFFLFQLIFFLSFFFFCLFLPLKFSLLWLPLLFIFFWTFYYFHLSYCLVNFRIVMSKLQHSQNHTSLLSFNHIYLCSFSIPLVINIYLYCIFNRFFLIEKTIHISHIYRSTLYILS